MNHLLPIIIPEGPESQTFHLQQMIPIIHKTAMIDGGRVGKGPTD